MSDPHNDWGVDASAFMLWNSPEWKRYVDEASAFPSHDDLRPMQAKINADIKRLAEISVAGCLPCRIDPIFEVRKPFVEPEPTMEQILDMLEAERTSIQRFVQWYERQWLSAWAATFDEVMRAPLSDLELDGRGSE